MNSAASESVYGGLCSYVWTTVPSDHRVGIAHCGHAR